MKLYLRVPSIASLMIVLFASGLLALPTSGELVREEGQGGAAKKKQDPTKKVAPKAKAKAKTPKKSEHDLVTFGQIKPVKGTDFWTFAYKTVEKGRPKAMTAFVKIGEDATFYRDKAVPVTDLKEGEAIWVFGRPYEQESPSSTGLIGIDRQLKNVAAIVTGDDVTVNASFKDPRDAEAQWVEAAVAKAGPAINATYDGNDFKVVMLGSAAVLRRVKEGDSKLLKSGTWVALLLDKSEERPETKSAADAKKPAYAAKGVIVLDPRLMRISPMLFE